MMSSSAKPLVIVHVIGELQVRSTGLEVISEVQFFRGLFWKMLFRLDMVHIRYLMGQKDDPAFTPDYLAGLNGRDIVVLLNPITGNDWYQYSPVYRGKINQIRRIIGQDRIVLAIQQKHPLFCSELEDLCGRSIQYKMMRNTKGNYAESVHDWPEPTEAIGIVQEILKQDGV